MVESFNEDTVRELLYQKYIEPTKRKRDKFVGIEIEMPILNYEKKAVDFSIIHGLTERFREQFHFDASGTDDDGKIYALTDSRTKDIFTFDCSYNNLELSFGKEDDLHKVWERFKQYVAFIQKELNRWNYTVTGMGINPYRRYNNNVPIPNGRYRMLYHHLFSYKNYKLPMYFHDYPQFGTYTSASQVQLDIDYDDIIKTLRAFSRLEPLKAVLFSNSVLLDENEELTCARDMLWENGMQGFNPHNIGMYDCELKTVDDFLEYIATTSIYCTEQEGKYINFKPQLIMDYMSSAEVEGEYYDNGEYRGIKINPKPGDLQYLRTFKFIDLTYRGTLEYRSVCCQPVGEAMCVAAFHLGLSECVDELDSLLEKDTVLYHHGYSQSELRKLLLKKQLPGFIDKKKLAALLRAVLNISAKGLLARKKGEEVFLDCLYERAERLQNPALVLLDQKPQLGLEKLIQRYADFG